MLERPRDEQGLVRLDAADHLRFLGIDGGDFVGLLREAGVVPLDDPRQPGARDADPERIHAMLGAEIHDVDGHRRVTP